MRNGAATRERLLEAAIAVIEAEGEVGVRVDQIATTAGVTKPVLYHHFGDREGLIVAAQAERFRRALRFGLAEVAAGAERCQSAADFAALVAAWVRSFGTVDGIQRRRMRIEVLGSAVSRPALHASVQAAADDHTSELAAIIQFAQERGWVSTQFSAATHAAWWTGLVLSRHLVETEPQRHDVDQWDGLTEHVLRFIMRPVGADV